MAGKKFKAAVPEVQIKTTGFLQERAMPNATKAALRSSVILKQVMPFSDKKAYNRGADLEPGQIIANDMPALLQIADIRKTCCCKLLL